MRNIYGEPLSYCHKKPLTLLRNHFIYNKLLDPAKSYLIHAHSEIPC